MILTGHDRLLADWVAQKAGINAFDSYTAMGSLDKDGTLMGATVFTNYHPEHGVIEMNAASSSAKWLTRDMINAMFSYVFDQLKCQMVVLRVSAHNSRMSNIAKKFGMESYLIPRLRGRNEDEWIFTYTDDQWRESPFRRK